MTTASQATTGRAQPARLRAPWTPEENALLGTMPDQKLARRLKRSYDAVAARRLHQGIPSFNPKRKLWRPEDDRILGTDIDVNAFVDATPISGPA